MGVCRRVRDSDGDRVVDFLRDVQIERCPTISSALAEPPKTEQVAPKDADTRC